MYTTYDDSEELKHAEITGKFYSGLGVEFPRIVKASLSLKQKVNFASIDPDKIMMCHQFLEDLSWDVYEEVMERVKTIKKTRAYIAEDPYSSNEFMEDLIYQAMMIKSTAGMAKQPVLAKLTSMLLSFLEAVKVIDDDVIDIVKAYENSTQTILAHDLVTMNEATAKAILLEMHQAIGRYVKRIKKRIGY